MTSHDPTRLLVVGCIAAFAIPACAGPTPGPYARLGLEEPPETEPRVADPAARLADGRPLSSWRPGEPVPCKTVEDCRFAAPSEVHCPGCCGFCSGSAVVPRGFVPIACSRPPPQMCSGVACGACPAPPPAPKLVCAPPAVDAAPGANSALGTCSAVEATLPE